MLVKVEMQSKSRPVRTCLGCGKKRQQQELLRFVAGREGRILLDEKGRLPGRGAYCCPDEKCLAGFMKKRGRLARALRCAAVECSDILELVKSLGKERLDCAS